MSVKKYLSILALAMILVGYLISVVMYRTIGPVEESPLVPIIGLLLVSAVTCILFKSTCDRLTTREVT